MHGSAGAGTGKVNYWGYTDGYYFAPKRAYCAGDNCVEEFSQMVRVFHEHGTAVLMEFWFPLDMAPAMAVEILRYWHMRLGVDGFRIIGSGGLLYAVRTDLYLSECVLLGDDFGGESFHGGHGSGCERCRAENYQVQRRLHGGGQTFPKR